MDMELFNILMVGFNIKNINAIEVFTEHSFPQFTIHSVERHFLTNFSLVLPVLDFAERNSHGFMIDVEGVGINELDEQAIEVLNKFTQKKPTILFTRHNKAQVKITLPKTYHLLHIPYDKSDMQLMLEWLDNKIQPDTDKSKKPVEKTIQPPRPTKNTLETVLMDRPEAFTVAQYIPNDYLQSLEQNYQCLSDTFTGINDTYFFQFFEKLQQLDQHAYIAIGIYSIYVNPFEKSIIGRHLDKFTQQLIKVHHENQSQVLSFQLVTKAQYEQQLKLLVMVGEKKIAISQAIWQMGLMLVPPNVYIKRHQLQIKALYMPNLQSVKNLPNYVPLMIACCLGKVRQIHQLQKIFPRLTTGQINQVLILMILSNIVDNQILVNSCPQSKI